MKRALVVIGTRPEAIKMAPVCRALAALGAPPRLIATGQQPALLGPALEAFGLRPDVDLELAPDGGGLAAFHARLLLALDPLLGRERPPLVLVHGDTSTSYAGALAAFYRGVPVVHVEAGLRSRRLGSPFPEEFHRQAVARLARLNCAPDAGAAENLLREGVAPERIAVTGNTVADAISAFAPARRRPSAARRLVLVTLHRRESLPDGAERVMSAVSRVAARRAEATFVCPLHPNPLLQAAARRSLGLRPNVRLIDPQRYDRFLRLLAASDIVLTDSGGLQEEAAYLGKTIILAREATERPSARGAAGLALVGTDSDAVERALELALSRPRPADSTPAVAAGAAERVARLVQGLLDA